MGKGAKGKGGKVAVDGGWIGVPCDFLGSRACAELSPLAAKMLLTLMGQLRRNHGGNGRLDAHAPRLRRYGWTSVASARAALRELADADLIAQTVAGKKGTVGLYGITLFPMSCDPRGLEVGPGAWRVAQWRDRPGAADEPNADRPATWARPRASQKHDRCSRSGNASAVFAPATGTNAGSKGKCAPVAGTHEGVSGLNAFPQRVPPLRDAISQRQRSGRMALILAKRTAGSVAPFPAYVAARAAFQPLAIAA